MHNIFKTYVVKFPLAYKTVVLLVVVYSFILGQTAVNEGSTGVAIGLDVLLDSHLEKIQGKTIALVTNQTGVDQNGIPNYKRLMELEGVDLKVIFTPEHGLFGEASAGTKVSYEEQIEGFPQIISLYSDGRKPTAEMLESITLILYDIQDIGARFYTYISTLGLVMEVAGELGVPVIILDRPNPLGGELVEGPILKPKYKSFVFHLILSI